MSSLPPPEGLPGPSNMPPIMAEMASPGRPQRILLEHYQRGTAWWLPWLGWIGLGWIALALLILSVVGGIVASRSASTESDNLQEKYHSLVRDAEDKVAIITIEGTIMHTDGFVKMQIDRVRKDEHVKAVVVRVDSPGGTITGSDYIFHHLKQLAKEKEIPLVISMGGIAASGGYYVSMAVGDAKDTIFAEPTTWTGSIGVIIPHYDVSELLTKWSISDDSIASNPLKMMGSPTRKQPPEIREKERKILQQLVDDSYQSFKDIVKQGRPSLSDEQLTEASTGQIFTAQQALKLGLVDHLGFVEDAIDRAIELARLHKTHVQVVRYTMPKGLLNTMLSGADAQGGGFSIDALLELTAPRAYYLCTWLPGVITSGGN